MDDFAALQSSVQESLKATTRKANSLAEEDLPFHRSIDPKFSSKLDKQNARLLSIAQRLVRSATEDTDTVRPTLKNIDDVDDNWNSVVDVIDSLLERAGTALDEFTGAVRRMTPIETTPAKANTSKHAPSYRNREIAKPQLLFDQKPDNYPTEPFRPFLQSKPHALTPLRRDLITNEETGKSYHEHPYQKELEGYEYPSSMYTITEPTAYQSFPGTTATMVDTEEALDQMLKDLRSAKEIAVDLEHHDHRSYIGVVSLMQISTREKDWIVDTLQPWRRKLERLNEVFADPSIVKVLHGAFMDAIWLQRDLGIYLVGLFDTYHAARALGYPGASYAYLLKRFTDVDAQKQYQMADWRIRPLPQELVDYARSDTHYLLYIFDNMRNELIERSDFSVPDNEKNKIHSVQERSREVALSRYEHPFYDAETGQGAGGWYKMISKTPAILSQEQFAVFRAVHQWRDNVAREQDDSTHYIMPNHVLHTLAKAIPATKIELLASAQPVTDAVRSRADELLATIVAARQNAKDGPEMIDVLKQFEPLRHGHTTNQSAEQGHPTGFDPKSASTTEGVSKVLSALPVRSMTSSFWGPALKAKPQEQHRTMSTDSTLKMVIPLPQLSVEMFTEAPVQEASEEERSEAEDASEQDIDQSIEEDVFILKELGKKRKLADVEASDKLAEQNDVVTLGDEEVQRRLEKAERRRLKKEAKQAAKDNAVAQRSNVEAFDYASAPSVLNQPSMKDGGHKGKKQANPYAKVLNTGKGLPRAQKEKAGRSMTYAS